MTDASTAGRVTAHVDPDLCVGVAQCVRLAPNAFALSAEQLSTFAPSGAYTREELEQAREFCPMSAISILDGGE